MSVEIRVLEDPAGAAGELLAEAAGAAGHLAVCGGTSVGAAYERAAQLRPDWGAVELWWGDERAVPPDDKRSNYWLVKATLLDRLAVPPQTVHRVETELAAEEAAARYDAALDGVTLALALNGIGPDGHTASLFPNAPALEETSRRAVAVEPGLAPWVERITLTPPVFAESALLVYLATGEAKAEAIRRAFAAEPDPATPASLVRGRETVALLDHGVASLL
jgi:6-phosphogluconolactonase